MKSFLIASLIIFSIMSCENKSQEKENHLILFSENEWSKITDDFTKKECGEIGHVSKFNNILYRRGVLKEVGKILNGPLYDEKIDRITFSGSTFDIGKISVTIIIDEIGLQYINSGEMPNKLYFSYKFKVTPNVSEVEGCRIKVADQNINITIRLDENRTYDIKSVLSY